MSLKVSHPYYTQFQHHMAVVERSWCDFVVFTVNVPAHTHSLAVVRVSRCQSFWTEHFIRLEKSLHSEVVLDIARSSFPQQHVVNSGLYLVMILVALSVISQRQLDSHLNPL